ncbi:MAG: GAF domain-containing protein [Rhodothermales bacterium]|nr:GAF domain-containing protein [Rhodothermales bacterium]
MTDELYKFPFGRELSLEGLIDFWRHLAEKKDSGKTKFARKLVSRIDAVPGLLGAIDDTDVLEQHSDLVAELMSAAFPFARWDDWYMGAITPFLFEAFYYTPGFKRLGLTERVAWHENVSVVGHPLSPQDMELGKTMNAYHYILREHYGVDAGFVFPMVYTSVDNDSGLKHYYKLHIDTRFTRCVVDGVLPALSESEIELLVQNPMDFEIWAKHLPPEMFTFRGLVIMTLVDVTSNEVHSLIKNALLQSNELTVDETIDDIEQLLQSLLDIPDLRIGILGLKDETFESIESAKIVGRSLLMDGGQLPECPAKHKSSYAHLFTSPEPVVITNLENCEYCTGFEYKLREMAMRSLIVAPLRTSAGRLVGILELASGVPNSLTTFDSIQLAEIYSLFASAMKRNLDEHEDRIAAVVKRQFTSIHPSVEWRFREAAERVLEAEFDGETTEFESIVFDHVYPLYGLSDIRDSSVTRNRAIQQDLLEQLGMALAVIVEASSYRPLPALDELGFRVGQFAQTFEQGLSSDTEVNAIEFLKKDVEPLFPKLASFGDSVAEKIQLYSSSLDDKLGVLYKRRKAYDASVALINETVSMFLDHQNLEAQRMFPHYFEKYKTDGVDYNIYIGQSIAASGTFDRLYLRNIRLWQLIAMCGVVWELEKIRESLPSKLETAHLVLVQDVPISVRFRQDEKKFDVDGAYNARYEIVKKRIDKAVDKRTGERITQPGHLSIVFSQTKEAHEYERYLEYLLAAGYIESKPELLELEDLQGVNGLRAFRVKVSEAPPDMEVLTRPEVVLSLANNHNTGGDGDGSAVIERPDTASPKESGS